MTGITAAELADVRIPRRRTGLFGLGYEADAVDALLDGISAQLNRRRQSAQHGQLRSAQDASDEAKLREMLERIRRGEL